MHLFHINASSSYDRWMAPLMQSMLDKGTAAAVVAVTVGSHLLVLFCHTPFHLQAQPPVRYAYTYIYNQRAYTYAIPGSA
jgi:hypothetical protein